MEIILIRHGLTQANQKKQYIGSTDVPLCEAGIEQLERDRRGGCYPPVERVYSSPMTRCVQTAKMIYPGNQLLIRDGLRETNFGDFEGKTYEELKEHPVYQDFLKSGGETAFPNGESRSEMSERVCAAFCSIVEELMETDCCHAAVITHGGVIMALLSVFSEEYAHFYSAQTENGLGFRLTIQADDWKQYGMVSGVFRIRRKEN
jgi:alpha-ribazole phosphatase